MWPRRFFWNVFFSLLASVLIFSIFFGGLLYNKLHETTLEALKQNLKKETEMLAALIETNPGILQQPRKILDVVHTQDRITIILPDGTVVVDNWADRLGLEALENHANRPEVQSALAGRPIFKRRYSNTIKTEMLYYAIPVEIDGKTAAVLRFSFALTTFQQQMASVRNFLLAAAGLAILLLLPLAYLISRTVQSPIERLRRSAGKLASGHLSEKVVGTGSLEFEELAQDFNIMADELLQKIRNIEQQHNRTEALLSRMVEGVLAVDRFGKAVFANLAFCRMVGLRPDRIEGKSYFEITRNAELCDYISALLKEDTPLEPKEIKLFGSEGERIFAVQASRIHEDHAAISMVLLVFHDITRIKRIEQVRKDFVANVSHELRTPLTALKGSTELLLDGAYVNPEECRKFLHIMDKQLRNIQNLVSDMLNLASVEETRTALRRETVNLKDLVQDTLLVVRHLSDKKDQNLVVHLPEDTIHLNVDPAQISDALINLLDNAVKYTQEGGTVELSIRINDENLLLEVVDNGPGIPADQISRIFERFYRVDKSRSRETGGTGLGLAIVKHAIENHGGTIAVESELGHGTRFTITLPKTSWALATTAV
jgi:two-component system, OmpR family, phosphate regulon sensor histidine kinase PhoR